MKKLFLKFRNTFALLLVFATVSQGIVAPSTGAITAGVGDSIWMVEYQ